MAKIIFYEKPGCRNNTKQKNLLIAAGHELDVKNILTESWTIDKLYLFFKDLPQTLWFNHSAPRIKSGEIIPKNFTNADGRNILELMVADPLLIRRPLIQVGQTYNAGFEQDTINNWIGLNPIQSSAEDLETCPRTHEEN
ncbi:ArsC/Spx/MgsR family protein [Candidatus Atelocyanobacterium thalassae]|uniref:Nitrogenase-associated protein n=1 Tax=cyanobacterium endosymbiont of Braarudosphaera bigelowii TaxID=1285375 RepID=A0ABN6JZX8_9CHRO|nr:ArsC/Spx/MgsR family protein [Candidatus Atelocyanobacterium thalassa]BDA40020.1 hypothetical protein CPARK_000086000 [cyanobacterium endosymbiont of Braarudosphaera bigelowii]